MFSEQLVYRVNIGDLNVYKPKTIYKVTCGSDFHKPFF